jgi:hypothetical protein
MLLTQLAQGILSGEVGSTYQDKIEAYKFMSDNWLLDQLSPYQLEEFRVLVEGGVIPTEPFRCCR